MAPNDRLVLDIRCAGGLVGRVVREWPRDRSTGGRLGLATLWPPGSAELAEADDRSWPGAGPGALQRSFVSLARPDVPGYDLASHYEAAREVGGDFFDLFQVRRGRRPLSIVIADVTGKGIGAGLLMAFARPLIHAAIDTTPGPAEALERTNRILVDEIRSGLFITALCGPLDITTGRLRLANAGTSRHYRPGDGAPIGAIEGGGVLLGAFPSLDVPELRDRPRPGDTSCSTRTG